MAARTIVVLTALGLAACGSQGAMTPRPSILLDGHHGTTVRLSFLSAVPDKEPVLASSGVTWITLDQWRQTLQNGFDAGFGRSFTVTHADAADLTIELDATVLTDVSAGGPEDAMSLRYQAHLLDPRGRTVATSSGTLTGRPEPGIQAAAHSVEAMYEKIANDFFNRPAAEDSTDR
jgi:hypothetical protein